MKVFLSWSGERSKHLAIALRDWIPTVIQVAKPWISGNDIQAGERWGQKIASELADSDFGVICLTAENISAPWILFEAGCLAKSLSNGRACPYLLGITPSDVPPPLGQFQALTAIREDTHKLVKSINDYGTEFKISDDVLTTIFSRSWPDLEKKIKEIPAATTISARRTQEEVLAEILDSVRKLVRSSVDIRGVIHEAVNGAYSNPASISGSGHVYANYIAELKEFSKAEFISQESAKSALSSDQKGS